MFSRPEIAAAQDQPFAWLNSARALSAQAPQPQHARTRPTAL